MIFLYALVLSAVFIKKGNAACYNATSGSTQLCNTCGGGSCTADNGCSCNSDPTLTCVPESECASVASNICCPSGFFWSGICCTDILTCNPACQNDQICTNVSNSATCACNTSIYSGLNISSLVPTVNCQSNIMTVSLSKCLLESLGYNSTSFQLSNSSDSCTNTYVQVLNNQTMQSIQALPYTGWCGNEVNTDSLQVTYSNILYIGNKNIISNDPVNFNFSCSYNLSMQISLINAIKPLVNSVNLTASGVGSVVTTMTAYWDAAYSIPINTNEDVPVGSNVYLGVFADAGDVNKFVLRVDSCYATPDNNVNNVNKVAIVSSGCPANQGVTAEVQANGISFESRIKFNSFAFQGQPLVYITCNIRLCDKNTTCTGCIAARSSVDQALLQIPLNFIDGFSSSASNTALSWVVMAMSLFAFLTKLF